MYPKFRDVLCDINLFWILTPVRAKTIFEMLPVSWAETLSEQPSQDLFKEVLWVYVSQRAAKLQVAKVGDLKKILLPGQSWTTHVQPEFLSRTIGSASKFCEGVILTETDCKWFWSSVTVPILVAFYKWPTPLILKMKIKCFVALCDSFKVQIIIFE